MTQEERQRQIAAIEQWLGVFCLPGQAVELRALKVQGKKAVCEVHQDLHQLASRAAELDALGAQGCYFTPNPLKPELAGWKDSRIKAEDVLCRHWLLVDCDSDKSRPTGTNATQAEKEAGWKVLDRCVGLLHSAGLRNAVIGDSGNGWHLCYPVDMPNDQPSQELMKAVLAGLARRCGDEQATVTLSTHDAPRIWKLYGTMARKGPHSEERPHRWSRLVEGKPWEQAVAQANTVALRALPGAWQAAEDLRRSKPNGEGVTVAERARKYVEKMPPAVSGNGGHDTTFEVAQVLIRGFALSRQQAWPILCEYNQRCVPPWSDKELAHKMDSAEKDSRLPLGYLLNGTGEHAVRQPTGGQQVPTRQQPEAIQGLNVTRMAEVEIRPVRWLVPDLIPLGKLTMIAGDGNHGKSSITIDLIATLTTGRPCLGLLDAVYPVSDAIVISCEDDLSDTVAPRLLAAGADLSRVYHINGVEDASGRVLPFSLKHYLLLEEYLGRNDRVRIVVIDPVGAFVGGSGVDDHKDSDLRSLLAPLTTLAAKSRTAIILVKHLNKNVSTKAASRVGGSVGYVNAVRSALLVAPDPEDDNRKLLLPIKANLSRKSRGIEYRLVDLDHEEAMTMLACTPHLHEEERLTLARQLYRIHWVGPASITADQALASPERKQGNDVEQAKTWLAKFLGERPRRSLDCRDQGNAALGARHDLKWWRDRILKEELGGKPRKTGQGAEQTWWFTLPSSPWPPESAESAESTENPDTPENTGIDELTPFDGSPVLQFADSPASVT